MNAFFDNAQQYQVLLNPDFEIVAFNQHAFRFNHSHGASALETGKSIFDYTDDAVREDFETQCREALNSQPVQYEHFMNGGWYVFTITPLHDTNGKVAGLAIVGNKVNEQKQATKTIRQQSECLSVIAQLQSHQVRHPVSSILSLVQLIKEEKQYPIQKDYIEALEKAAAQLDDIIRTIVNQSRNI